MRRTFFERHYGHLAASEDARKALGPAVREGIATIGDIRTAFEGHPPDSSVYPDNSKSGFYITDANGKPLTA